MTSVSRLRFLHPSARLGRMGMGFTVFVVCWLFAEAGLGQGPNREEELELLRDEITQTVAQPEDVDEEIGSLFSILGS